MKAALLVHLMLAAGPATAQDDLATRLQTRIDRELQEAVSRMRQGVREMVLKELAAAKIDRFASNLRDDPIHNRLKKFLFTKEGKSLVERFMDEQNMETLEELVDLYFEKEKGGRMRVRDQYEEVLNQILEDLAPPDPPKSPAAPKLEALGARYGEVTEDQRKESGLAQDGIRITEIEPDGPAAKAGLKPEDAILSMGGKTLKPGNVDEVLGSLPRGTDIVVVYYRGRDRQTVTIRLREGKSK